MDNNKKAAPPMVVACIDGSTFSAAVCDYAAWLSQRVRAPLKLLHNIERRPVPPADLSGAIGLGAQEQLLEQLTQLEQERGKLELERGRRLLQDARERVAQKGVEEPLLRQRHGSLAESLIDCEDEIRILVLGIRGEDHESDAVHLGNHLETIVRSLHRPILVVNQPFAVPQRIMLAYDGSDNSRKALDMVVMSPLFKDIPCHLVYVRAKPANDDVLEEACQILRAAGHEVIPANVTGKSAETLRAYQQDHQIDMTVMGAFGRSRLRELLLGSFTVNMLLATQKPLLLLR